MRNFADFEPLKPTLLEALHDLRRDPFLKDLAGKFHNSEGTISGMLWNLQTNLNPDRSSLWPLLDFEEHHQKVFLRRGLVVYCGILLDELKRESETAPEQSKLFT